MTFNLTIPVPEGEPINHIITCGETLFVLGANGTGKSSIMHKFYRDNHRKARRISAHRQTWFTSNTIDLSPQQKRNTESSIIGSDTNETARWRDDYSSARASMAVYDLIDAENVRAREITSAVDNNNIDLAQTLAKKDAPIKIINELLSLSNIPIEISVQESDQVVARKLGGSPYSIAELSDGERNAMLIAATVLTSREGTLFLIDEPERHLHRAIVSPLLTLLFSARPDCAFIISTHEIALPLDNPGSKTLLVRRCQYNGQHNKYFDADLVTNVDQIDAVLKKDILGARRKILFIEGTDQSLDKPLYSLIFPSISVIAKSSCRDVEYAVSGIRDADILHWVKAFGIVDNDRRTLDDIDRLKNKGIYALPFYSVESIYYHPEIQKLVAERYADVVGVDAENLLSSARQVAIAAITPHIQRLSERAAERKIREQVFSNLPRSKDISSTEPIEININVASIIAEEVTHLQLALNEGDIVSLLTRYPIRETPALSEIAVRLGFQNRRQYEGAVRKLLSDNSESLNMVRSFFGTLYDDITLYD